MDRSAIFCRREMLAGRQSGRHLPKADLNSEACWSDKQSATNRKLNHPKDTGSAAVNDQLCFVVDQNFDGGSDERGSVLIG